MCLVVSCWYRKELQYQCRPFEKSQKGRFLLSSVALLILSHHVEALQIFKLEIGVKKDIVYKTIDLSIFDFVDVPESFQFISILTDSF